MAKAMARGKKAAPAMPVRKRIVAPPAQAVPMGSGMPMGMKKGGKAVVGKAKDNKADSPAKERAERKAGKKT